MDTHRSSGLQPGVRENIFIKQKETQEPLETLPNSDPSTHEDSSPNWGRNKLSHLNNNQQH
jgi:hypothetical protein